MQFRIFHTPNWKNILNTGFYLPVSIENDADCADLSEIYFKKYKSVKDAAFLYAKAE